jgi:hypothetical protein
VIVAKPPKSFTRVLIMYLAATFIDGEKMAAIIGEVGDASS